MIGAQTQSEKSKANVSVAGFKICFSKCVFKGGKKIIPMKKRN